MDLRYLARLMSLCPLRFVGLFEEEKIPSDAAIASGDFVGVVWQREVEHFYLFGRVRGQSFTLDSNKLQASPICSLYCFLFANCIAADALAAESLFLSLRSQQSLRERAANDMLIFDAVSAILTENE